MSGMNIDVSRAIQSVGSRQNPPLLRLPFLGNKFVKVQIVGM